MITHIAVVCLCLIHSLNSNFDIKNFQMRCTFLLAVVLCTATSTVSNGAAVGSATEAGNYALVRKDDLASLLEYVEQHLDNILTQTSISKIKASSIFESLRTTSADSESAVASATALAHELSPAHSQAISADDAEAVWHPPQLGEKGKGGRHALKRIGQLTEPLPATEEKCNGYDMSQHHGSAHYVWYVQRKACAGRPLCATTTRLFHLLSSFLFPLFFILFYF